MLIFAYFQPSISRLKIIVCVEGRGGREYLKMCLQNKWMVPKGTIESQHSHNSKNTRETNMQHGRKKVSTFSIEIHEL